MTVFGIVCCPAVAAVHNLYINKEIEMPCAPDPNESKYYHELQQKQWEKDDRWDLLASKEQVAGWLCDALRGDDPTPEAKRWFDAHRKFGDKK